MPEYNLNFASLSQVPTELQSHAKKVGDTENYTLTVYAGENVAGELNPALEKTKNDILGRKTHYKTQYTSALSTINTLNQQLVELNAKLVGGGTATAEELEVLTKLKALGELKDVVGFAEQFPAINKELNDLKSEKANSELFKLSGFGNEKVFLDLISDTRKNQNLVRTEVKPVEGKQVAYAVIKDGNGVESTKTLAEYIKDNAEWQSYMPLLGQQSQQQQSTWFTNPNDTKVPIGEQDLTNSIISGINASANPTKKE